MAKTKPSYQIPFDNSGHMLNYVHKHPGPWREVVEFEASLRVVQLHRGRSRVVLEMVDANNRTYWISLKEFMRLVLEYDMYQGELPRLWWTFKKQGFSYFIYEVKIPTTVRQTIDNMTQFEMARMHRFAPMGEPMFFGAVGTYFGDSFRKKGGMTPAISKAIGWGDIEKDKQMFVLPRFSPALQKKAAVQAQELRKSICDPRDSFKEEID